MHRSKQPLYSITSSAVESSVGGTMSPSILAVLALINEFELGRLHTGMSAGLGP
jgi:hypothetical protein